jgi:hypothetical protein
MVSAGHPTSQPRGEKRVVFVLNVLCGIHDASKIHGLHQGNKIACPNHGQVLLCALSCSACTQPQHCTVLYIGYRISAHLCQCDHSSRQRKMDEQARRPAKSSPKRHLTQVDKYPCPGDTSARSGLDTTVACTCQSVHYFE